MQFVEGFRTYTVGRVSGVKEEACHHQPCCRSARAHTGPGAQGWRSKSAARSDALQQPEGNIVVFETALEGAIEKNFGARVHRS